MKRAWTRRKTLAALACLPAARLAGATPFSNAMETARRIDQLRSLIIARDGQVIAAEAFRGPSLETPVNVKSVSKSFVSALTGIAIARGEIEGLDTRVAPLIARQVPRRADHRVRDITVRHMLSMQSGLQEVSGAAYGAWVDTKFWIYEALSKPMIADPGTAYLYSTASYHVLGAILRAVSGQDLHRLAKDRLGTPLGIELPPWTRDPQGLFVGGNDMLVSPLGLLTFGEMYRRNGRHASNSLLSEDWVKASWTPYGTSRETGHGYGFGWFIWDVRGTRVTYARGYGGQMIFILPEHDVTVVITSNPGLPATMDGHLGALLDLLTDQIMPDI